MTYVRLFCSGHDMESDLCLDLTAGGLLTHKTMKKQVKFLENSLDKHTSFIMKTKPLQEKIMSNFEEPSSVESKPIPSTPLDLTHEPSPEP